MPRLSDTMAEGVIVAWNKKVGDSIKPGDVLAEVETDKATMDLESYNEGVILYIGVEAGKAAKVDGILAIVGKAGEAYEALLDSAEGTSAAEPTATPSESAPIATTTQAPAPVTTAPAVTSGDDRVKASPLAKKIAADKGIDLRQVSGSGDGGRITKKDIDQYTPTAADSSASVPVFLPVGQEGHTDIPLTQMRKTIARRLSESMFGAPHFYLKMEINMDNAMDARTAINAVSPVKVSFNDMIIKACAHALRKHPDVNSSWMNDYIRQNHHIHIGSAVAMPDGLIVPVIRFADQKSLAQIASETKSLYTKAKEKKLQPA